MLQEVQERGGVLASKLTEQLEVTSDNFKYLKFCSAQKGQDMHDGTFL